MRLLVVLLTVGLLPTTAWASDSLQRCRAVAEKEQRLQCYDQLADSQASRAVAPQSVAPATVVISSSPQADPVQGAVQPAVAAQTDENLFGTSGQKIESTINELAVTVTEVRKDNQQRLQFTMHNGQRWQQLVKDHFAVRAGDSCLIRSGVFKSFTLKCEQASKIIKIRRLE